MQKLWRGSNSLVFSIPISKLPMPSAFQLQTLTSSPFTVSSTFRYDLAHRASISFCCDLSLRRAWSPLLLQARDPCPAWLFTGSGGRGLTVSQGLRGQEKRPSTAEESCDENLVSGVGESRSQATQAPLRQRGGNSASAEVANVDLLIIPGVGPRNLRKLK